ncbi:MAG: DMT family transporter [Pasteurella oralis]|uniref:DMT family transporter n=1 Tax=Pasteurella oralis TaxID=1071947 RepID=UPI00270E17FE|nr:DMT family transporter [Pasteurella oralis]
MAHFAPTEKTAMIGLVVGCIIFGLGSLIVAYVPVGAYAIAFWRLLVAVMIFYTLAKCFKQHAPISSKAKHYALISGAFLGLDLALWHESIYAVGPGISTLLNSLQIFWLSAIGFFWFRERQSTLQLFSLCLAVFGVALIGGPEFKQNDNALWGFVSGIVSGLMLALSMVYIRKTQQAAVTPIFPLMFRVSVGGMLILFVPALWLNSTQLYPTTWEQLGLILIYGAVMQCLAWGMIAYSIPLLSLSVTGLLLLSEPVAALVIDYLLLNKMINGLQWCGALLTMLAIYLGSLRPTKPPKY